MKVAVVILSGLLGLAIPLYADLLGTLNNLTSEKREEQIHLYLSKPITKETAVLISAMASPDLAAAYQDLQAKKAAYSREASLENPIVSAGVLPQGHTSKIDISIEQDLINWLVIPMQRNKADAQIDADQFMIAQEILDLSAETKKAWISYQSAIKIDEIQSDYTDAEAANFELIQRQYNAGNINELQLKTYEVVYEDALKAKRETETQLKEKRLILQRSMGLSPTQSEWTVAADFSETLPDTPSIDELDLFISEQRPDLTALRARFDAERSRLDIQETKDRWGSIKLGLQYEKEFDGVESIGPKIEFGIPLFNQTQWTQHERDALTRQQSALVHSRRYGPMYEMRRIVTQLDYERVTAQRSKEIEIPLYAQLSELSQKHYNYMLLGVSALIQAKQAELKARQEYIRHIESFWMAWVDLEREVGGHILNKGNSND